LLIPSLTIGAVLEIHDELSFLSPLIKALKVSHPISFKTPIIKFFRSRRSPTGFLTVGADYLFNPCSPMSFFGREKNIIKYLNNIEI
jgi:hypothetical protein